MHTHSEIVHGQPLQVDGRTLTPVVRRTSAVQKKAAITAVDIGASGTAIVRLQPLGLVEECGERQRWIPIPNRTAQILGFLAAVALIVPLLAIMTSKLTRQ